MSVVFRTTNGGEFQPFVYIFSHIINVMGKLITAAVTALVTFVLLDQHLHSGRYTDAALAVLRQMRHSFG